MESSPFIHAAFKRLAELAGAQAAQTATYKVIDWSYIEERMLGRVRVDGDSFTGSFHGEVKVTLHIVEKSFVPDTNSAAA